MLPSSDLPARRLRDTLHPLISEAARESRADRYRKHFSAHSHVWMLIMHAMSANQSLRQSLRQSHAAQQADPGVRGFLGTDERRVSYSQLARSSTSRPSDLFERLLRSVLGVAYRDDRRGGRRAGPPEKVLREVRLLDSTFFALCAKLSPWGKWNERGNAGVRLQTLLDPVGRLPTDLRLEALSTNDANALGALELSGLRGKTLVFDLGYYCHAHFERLREGGVHFVTRLNAQAHYEVTQSRPLPEGATAPATTPEGDMLLSDRTIALGSPNNRRGAVLEKMRLVTSKNRKGEVHSFVTDRHDLTAPEVLYLYRKRWQIELFFRWLKKQLGATKPLGHSPEAVWLTIVVAAIVAVLMSLSEERRPKGITRVSWMRALCTSFSMLRLSG
jgi:Transposase DDE domain